MATPPLLVALDYLELLAEVKPEKLEPAAARWHGRLEVEATSMTLAESQLALAALASLCAGERDAIAILRRLVRRVRPTLIRHIGRQAAVDSAGSRPTLTPGGIRRHDSPEGQARQSRREALTRD